MRTEVAILTDEPSKIVYASAMTETVQELSDLYSDAKTCAVLVGLQYVEDDSLGYTRVKRGKGFSYKDLTDHKVVDAKMKQAITELVIPPAWKEVWICPKPNGHVLATGIDERGRKQYMYHPKWRTMRDLIKFYRTLVFGAALPKIRRSVDTALLKPITDRHSVIAAMVWILDNTYIRIGNDVYFDTNASVGLTTLTDKHIVIPGDVVTLSFKGKSGKDQQITFENKAIARLLDELRQVRGARLFRYKSDAGWKPVDSGDINGYLHEVTEASISAKDYRTWGGTLMAFDYLITEDAKHDSAKPDKARIGAVDQAAAILGNTRSIARESYVHPHILNAYGSKDFRKLYEQAAKARKITGLDRRESELLHFLESLFETQFDLLKR